MDQFHAGRITKVANESGAGTDRALDNVLRAQDAVRKADLLVGMKAAALRVAVQKHEAAVQALDAVRSEMETLRVRVPQLQAWVDAFDLADKLSKLIAKLTTSHPSHDDAIRSIVSRAVR